MDNNAINKFIQINNTKNENKNIYPFFVNFYLKNSQSQIFIKQNEEYKNIEIKDNYGQEIITNIELNDYYIYIIDFSNINSQNEDTSSIIYISSFEMQYLYPANNNKIKIKENISQFIIFNSNIKNITYSCDINNLNKNIEIIFHLINISSYEVKIYFDNTEFNNYFIDINNRIIKINKNDYSNKCMLNQICICEIKIILLSENNNIKLETILKIKEDLPYNYNCPIDKPFYMINEGCVDDCHTEFFFKKECSISNKEPKIVNIMINTIKKEIPDEAINYFLTDVIERKSPNLIVNNNNIVYEITTSDNLDINNNNISIIYLGECGKRLKKIYNIKNNETIIIFKIDYLLEGLFIPIVEYELYHPINKTKMDLNYCKDLKIDISLLVNINEQNLFKHNSSDPFYNDLCFPYTTENKTDIILQDRKDEFIKNNLSLCEKNCEYEEYNKDTKRVMCKCNIKQRFRLFSEIIIDTDKLLNNFINIKTTTNLYVLKCYKLLFTKEGIINNIGFYIILVIIIIFSTTCFIFWSKHYKTFLENIKKILKIRNNIKKKIKDNTQKKNIIDIQNNNKNTDNKIKNKNVQEILNIKKKEDVQNKTKIAKKNLQKPMNKLNTNGEVTYNSYDKFDKNYLIDSINKINEKPYETLKMNDYELNSLYYEEALKIDKRTYIQYYISLLKTKHLLVFTFYTNDDYNAKIIKISLFFFFLALYYTVNALFFNDSTMHKIYEDNGIFNLIYQIPKILYSTIISLIINTIVKNLSLTEKNITKIIKERGDPFENLSIKIKYLKIKFILFFILSFLFLLFFWYYISCFCAVYKNTQIHLIKDTLISFGLSLIYPLAINLIPGIFRIPSLNKNNRKILYNLSKIIQLI